MIIRRILEGIRGCRRLVVLGLGRRMADLFPVSRASLIMFRLVRESRPDEWLAVISLILLLLIVTVLNT